MTEFNNREISIRVTSPMAPPAWALLEREILRLQSLACKEYYEKYFDHQGYLKCVVRWGGNDGPDDAIESLTHWPILHILGGPESIWEMCETAWEGHLQQYTEAKTVEVPFAKEGMYYKDFPVMFDWLHNGEGLTVFNLQGLSDPDDTEFKNRVKRYAGFYMNEDLDAPNYDPEHRIIRSMFNGSKGPLLRKATPLDWAGDPIEVEGRFIPRHGENNYKQMLEHFKDYTDVVGDHPQNLVATGLAFNAYALTTKAKYKDWLLEYIDAWVSRMKDNDGIIPSNIGLDGTIGGETNGKWYGGCYGWAFSVIRPETGTLAHRNLHHLGLAGFGNAFMLTGKQQYFDIWREMIERINSNARIADGVEIYPHMYGDEGWYAYTEQPYSNGAEEIYYWSMDGNDLPISSQTNGWIAFLEGKDEKYPVRSLQEDFEKIRKAVVGMREDPTTPETRLSDDPMKYNPASVVNLVHLMLGGLTPKHAQPIHCRLRYFDPILRRSGIPEDCGALVEKLTHDEVTVSLVNINPVEERIVLIQGGAYAEHTFTHVKSNDIQTSIMGTSFQVRLGPGCGTRMVIKMKRYENQPTFAFPWNRKY